MTEKKDVSEEERYERAKTCSSCLEWHDICDAECCKSVFLDVTTDDLKKAGSHIIADAGWLNPSDKWYYRLHKIDYARGKLRIPIHRVDVVNGELYYFCRCALLDDENKCMGHPGRKPEMCRDLCLENIGKPAQKFRVTNNCLFKYKRGNFSGKEK